MGPRGQFINPHIAAQTHKPMDSTSVFTFLPMLHYNTVDGDFNFVSNIKDLFSLPHRNAYPLLKGFLVFKTSTDAIM